MRCRLLGKSHLESVPRTEPATTRHSAQMRTAPLRAVAADKNVAGYAFLRLAMPTRPSRPEPKSQTAAGIGTADTPTVKESPHIGC